MNPLDMPATRTAARPHRPHDATLTVAYWNHVCPTPGCMAWVPNHQGGCGHHQPTEPIPEDPS